MPKGKKFNAAEQHFLKKEQQYRKQIKELEQKLSSRENELKGVISIYETCGKRCQEQDEQITKLLKYCELSKEDIKKACEKDKAMAEIAKMINLFASSIIVPGTRIQKTSYCGICNN